MQAGLRCPNCRTFSAPVAKFCFVCGTPLPGKPSLRRSLPDAAGEAERDSASTSKTMLVLGGLTAIGIARSLVTHFNGSWKLAALLAIGGISAIAWAAIGRKDAPAGKIALGVFGTLVVVLVSAVAIIAGGYLLLLVACKAILEAFGGK